MDLADDWHSWAHIVGSSHIGSGVEARQMLQLAADKQIKPWVVVRPMKEAAEGIKAIEDGSIRYRTVSFFSVLKRCFPNSSVC